MAEKVISSGSFLPIRTSSGSNPFSIKKKRNLPRTKVQIRITDPEAEESPKTLMRRPEKNYVYHDPSRVLVDNAADESWLQESQACSNVVNTLSLTSLEPQPVTGSHQQIIDCVMDDFEKLLACWGSGTTAPLRRKHSAIDVEHQPSSSRSKQQKRTVVRMIHQANSGSHQQTINHDNPTFPAFTRNSGNQNNATETKLYELRFSKKICQKVFAGKPVKGEDDGPLMVNLFNVQSGQLVTSGPEASARVELVVLNAYFDENSLTREQFKSNIIRKEGNKPFLAGTVVFNLQEGIARVDSVGFSQTKRWTRKFECRLGVIVMDNDMGINIKEGFTDSFVVRDGHLKSTKHYPPTPSSEVWRLDGIAENGSYHQLLRNYNLNTVEDFLIKQKTDPQELRKVLKKMSAIQWEALVAHAHTCTIDESQKLPTIEISSDTDVEISSDSDSDIESFGMSEKRDVSQPAVSFHFKEYLPSRDNGMCSTIQESGSGDEVLISPETVELDSRNSVVTSQEYIDSDRDYISFDLEISPRIETRDVSQQADSFYSKEYLVNDPSRGNRMSSGCQADESQKLRTIEVSSDSDIESSPRISPTRDVSQQAASFHSKEYLVDDPSRGNRMCSTIQESSSGGQILISPETVELDSRNSVVPSEEHMIDSCQDNELFNKPNDQEVDERSLQIPVEDVPFDSDGLISESPDNPQKEDGNGPPFIAIDSVNSPFTATKHYPSTPSSEVGRLDGIADWMALPSTVNTEGFLIKHKTDPQELRKVLKKIPAIQSEALVAHAYTCTIDEPQKLPTIEVSSDTDIEISPRIETCNFSQQAVSFHSKEYPPSRDNGMCSTIQESSSGGEIVFSPEPIELDFRIPVVPSQEHIDSDEDIKFYNKLLDSDLDTEFFDKLFDLDESLQHFPVKNHPFDTTSDNLFDYCPSFDFLSSIRFKLPNVP